MRMSEMGMEIINEMLVAALAEAFPNCPALQATHQNQQPEEDQCHV
ncbi:hypothetical protein [Sphingorhabdus sp.]